MPEPGRPEPAHREPDEPPAVPLSRAILGEDPAFTAHDVAADSGVTIEQARRLWRSLGFPEPGGEAAFTRADIDAVSTLVRAVDTGLFDFDLAVNATRAVGQTMSRLAEWEVAAMLHRVEELSAGEPIDTPSVAAQRLVEQFSGSFEALLIYAWRRHLAAAVARVEASRANEEDVHTTQVTVGFADIVGFTALSNEVSEDRLGDLVELFESRCSDVVAGQRGRVIKSIGDSVLFVNDDPVRAFDTAEGIINVIGRDPRMPDVRVGLASGSVVLRLGDVFGPAVNLASRLTAVARRNRVIIDAATAALLPEGFETRPLPARPVRGFGLVEPVAVRRH
ncbi:adenylate/guanylate cyclase domain-containing protein [Nocardioides ferulae]|uniref:adenylate/guanylate cyclase domain-containing protein n=1 Tax=Nocardioides ferulae TaxID=2340821 RepID=UPI000EB0D7C3|nr:adenylate/guanylate cyclase domain-containing protein [Nocardioides ferulae]